MNSLVWQVANRTAETLLILNLFHLLLAGLTLIVLLHRWRGRSHDATRPEFLLPAGFALLVLHFALLTLYFGAAFFFRRGLELEDPERLLHGILIAGLLAVMAAYVQRATGARPKWFDAFLAALAAIVTLDLALNGQPLAGHSHSVFMLASDAIGGFAACLALREAARRRWEARRLHLAAIAATAVVLLLHGTPSFLARNSAILMWNADEHLLSLALFAFAWASAERSGKLLERVFVRLNLTFIVLASVIMLITAGMEKFQYFRLTEERSANMAEFLRGHVIYYGAQGETLGEIFAHPEVIKRVVVEFGSIPELRRVLVKFRGERATFTFRQGGEVTQAISHVPGAGDEAGEQPPNQFSILQWPIGDGPAPEGRIELIGTTEFVNERIGNYIIFIYSSFTAVLLMATAVIGIIVANTDRQLQRQYTELQEAQQQLSQAAKLASIGELAGGMAHEINNPITGILSLASHLAEGSGASRFTPRDRKSLELIVSQAERIAGLVRGLLTFSRQSQLHLATVDIGELLATALDLVQFRMTCNIAVVRDVDYGLPAVAADSSRLTEVFVNLLSNAIDAMPEGGTLTVRAKPDAPGGQVRIEIADTGVGIAPEQLPRIFDPFFTTKPPGCGTGLGLSISHGIVKDHGGQIRARSVRGSGTTITVLLPQEENRYEAACVGDR